MNEKFMFDNIVTKKEILKEWFEFYSNNRELINSGKTFSRINWFCYGNSSERFRLLEEEAYNNKNFATFEEGKYVSLVGKEIAWINPSENVVNKVLSDKIPYLNYEKEYKVLTTIFNDYKIIDGYKDFDTLLEFLNLKNLDNLFEFVKSFCSYGDVFEDFTNCCIKNNVEINPCIIIEYLHKKLNTAFVIISNLELLSNQGFFRSIVIDFNRSRLEKSCSYSAPTYKRVVYEEQNECIPENPKQFEKSTLWWDDPTPVYYDYSRQFNKLDLNQLKETYKKFKTIINYNDMEEMYNIRLGKIIRIENLLPLVMEIFKIGINFDELRKSEIKELEGTALLTINGYSLDNKFVTRENINGILKEGIGKSNSLILNSLLPYLLLKESSNKNIVISILEGIKEYKKDLIVNETLSKVGIKLNELEQRLIKVMYSETGKLKSEMQKEFQDVYDTIKGLREELYLNQDKVAREIETLSWHVART